jgi:hypothetical protein
MHVRILLCCAVLSRRRPCVGLITLPSSPAKRLNAFVIPDVSVSAVDIQSDSEVSVHLMFVT